MPEAPLTEAELGALGAVRHADHLQRARVGRAGAPGARVHHADPDLPVPAAAADGRLRAHRADPLRPAVGLSAAEQRQARLEYYRYVAAGGGPKIVVIQDVDSRIGFGCFWGEVQTAIHKALGCQGLVTDGGVRDLDAVAPGFQVLCGKVTPSHAWVHAIAFGGTVDVFGMIARSDDLIHADRHGAVVIPREVAREVVKAAELCARREEPILKVARSPDFSLDALERAMAEAAEIH